MELVLQDEIKYENQMISHPASFGVFLFEREWNLKLASVLFVIKPECASSYV